MPGCSGIHMPGPHPWLWRWKQQLDQRFMRRFRHQAAMRFDPKSQGIDVMACRGCAAKLPAHPLQQALRGCQSEDLANKPEDAMGPSHQQARRASTDIRRRLPGFDQRPLAEWAAHHPARLLRPLG